MNKIMSWLENSFQPKMEKVVKNPWIAGMSGTMLKTLPFILVGSLICLYNVFRSWIPQLPDLGVIFQYTFQMLSLIMVFMTANQLMEKLGHEQYTINAGMTGIIVYIMCTMPSIDENGNFIIVFDKLGPSGMFAAMVIGVFVAIIYHLYSKLHFLENSTSIPDFVAGWINQMIPIFLGIFITMILVIYAKIDVYNILLMIFEPLKSFGFSLPGFIALTFARAFLYSMGISTWFLGPIADAILLGGTAANIAAAAAGEAIPYIVCYETVYALCIVAMGGTGCTLPLNIMMMRSKSKKMKTLGRVCIAPSLFNINEPIVFGTPIVFNPLLMIPMWISAIVMPIVTWIPMAMNLLEIPAASLNTGQVPAPFGYLIITGDYRCFIFYILAFVIMWFIWLPFFKIYEKKLIIEEQGAIVEK